MYGARGWVAHHNTDLWRATGAHRRRRMGHVADRRRLAVPCTSGITTTTAATAAYLRRALSAAEGRRRSSSSTRCVEDRVRAMARHQSRRCRRRTMHPSRRVALRGPDHGQPDPPRPVRRTASRPAKILGVDAAFRRPALAARPERLPPNRVGGRASCRSGRGLGRTRARARPPPRLASLRLVPEQPDHPAAARPSWPAARQEVARDCAATCPPAGPSPGASTSGRGCSDGEHAYADPRRAPAQPLAHLSQHVRRASAVPDRRQLRRDTRHRRDAAAEPRRRDRAAARAAGAPGPTGSVRGLRARGGFEVDLAWTEGRLERAVVRSSVGGRARLRYAGRTRALVVPPGGEAAWDGRP